MSTDLRNIPPKEPLPEASSLSPPACGLKLLFGRDDAAVRHLRTGWSDLEATEVWTVGTSSTLVLPRPVLPGPHLLVLHLRPHVADGKLDSQRLRIAVNGVVLGDFRLTRKGVRACLVPARLLAGHAQVEIVFETPDAARPSDLGSGTDTRPLAVALSALSFYPDRFGEVADADEPVPVDIAAVMRADRMPLSQLMMRFESLGQNCEFGLVQRRCAAEPLGLLRFASTPLPNLLASLEADFAGMGDPDAVSVEMSSNGREFMVKDTRYGIVYHAWVNAGEMTAEALRERELRRVPILVRKLLEDLATGEKILVFKGMGAISEEAAFPLAAALRRYGPNTLLVATLADAAHKAGTVEARAPGLLFGYLDRFAPSEDAQDFALDQWVGVCRAAYRQVMARASITVCAD